MILKKTHSDDEISKDPKKKEMRLHQEFLVKPRIIKEHRKEINWIIQITFEIMTASVWKR